MFQPNGVDSSSPVDVSFGSPTRQNRLTVLFRLLLLIPQMVVLYFVGIAAFVVLVIGWFGALVTGRLPGFAAEFLTGYLRWSLRVAAYEMLLTDKYPPFSLQPSASYPVDLEVRGGRLNRWAVLFRLVLVIPAAIVSGLLTLGMGVFGIVTWVVTLVKGEMPRTFFGANAAALRYATRYAGYFYMLTSVYPGQVLGDKEGAAAGLAPGWAGPAPAAPPSLVPGATAPPWVGSAPPPPAGVPSFPVAQEPSFSESFHSGPTGAPELVPPGRDVVPAPVPGPGPRRPLVLSAGARNLVVVFIVLGVLVYPVDLAIAIPTFLGVTSAGTQAVTAQHGAVAAYNVALHGVQSFSTQGAACQSGNVDAAEVRCLETNDATLASTLQNYGTALSSIDFPSSVDAQATAAESAAAAAAQTMTSLSTAGTDPQTYQADVDGSSIQSDLDQVTTTFDKLDSALVDLIAQ